MQRLCDHVWVGSIAEDNIQLFVDLVDEIVGTPGQFGESQNPR